MDPCLALAPVCVPLLCQLYWPVGEVTALTCVQAFRDEDEEAGSVPIVSWAKCMAPVCVCDSLSLE